MSIAELLLNFRQYVLIKIKYVFEATDRMTLQTAHDRLTSTAKERIYYPAHRPSNIDNYCFLCVLKLCVINAKLHLSFNPLFNKNVGGKESHNVAP